MIAPVISPAPPRSLEQRLDALARANEVRMYRSRLKRDIAEGRASFLRPLMAPCWLEESMRVLDLLLAIPMVGRVKALKTLNVARVSPSKTLGGLTDRQRLELSSLLRTWMRPVDEEQA